MLNERNLRLLSAIDRYGLLTTAQIHELCFAETAKRTMLRRLRVLKKRKFINHHAGLPRGQLVWTLALAGLKRLGSMTSISVNKNALEHDVQVSRVRMALDRAELGSDWRSYHEMRVSLPGFSVHS